MRGRLNPNVTSQESPCHGEKHPISDHSSATGVVCVLIAPPECVWSDLCDFFFAAQGRLVVSSHESARELKGAGVCKRDRRGEGGCATSEGANKKVTVENLLCGTNLLCYDRAALEERGVFT